jgi:branched-chain amino acid transport system substrate-binding protein
LVKLRKLGIFGVFAAFTLTACGGNSSSTSNSQPIKIGVTGPFSGNYAAPGIDIMNAAKVMATTLNKAGGINGRKVDIVSADDQCDAQVGVQAAENLVSQQVVALVGGYCSGASIPESDVLRRHHSIPFITVASSNPKFTEQGYNNVFRVILRDDFAGTIDAGFMSAVVKSKKVAIMHDNSTYAKALAEFGRDELQKKGATVTYFDAITPGQRDYSSALTRVASTNPDTFYFTGYYPEAGTLVKEYKDLGLDKKFAFMVGSGEYDPAYVTAGGPAADGSTVTFPVGPDTATGKDFDTFRAAYKAATGKDMATYAIYEHDAIMMLKLAIEKAKSTKPADIDSALHQVSYAGITGNIKFDQKGDRQQLAMVGFKVSGGKFVPTWKLTGGKWVSYS